MMKKAKNLKKGVTCMALAALITAMGITPMTAVSAATNNQASTDSRKDNEASVTVTATIPTAKKEITLNVGGTYQLKPSVSKVASELGFWIEGNNLKVNKVNAEGDTYTETYPLVWKTNKKKVSVSATGKVKGLKVSTINPSTGNYYVTTVTASVDPSTSFVGENDITYLFEDGVVFTQYVTTVPTEDLNVYFQGVWSEDFSDNDAQHTSDYAVRETNVNDQLKAMAEAVTGHCVGTTYEIVSFTKTNDGCVRAYITTHNEKAGNHYYVAKFYTTESGKNKITFTQRDYCEKEYTVSGSYNRAK